MNLIFLNIKTGTGRQTTPPNLEVMARVSSEAVLREGLLESRLSKPLNSEQNHQLFKSTLTLNFRKLKRALEKGADINAKDELGMTALSILVHNSSYLSRKILCTYFGLPEVVSEPSKKNVFDRLADALDARRERRRAEMVIHLLSNGAAVTNTDPVDSLSLIMGIRSMLSFVVGPHQEEAERLLNTLAEPEKRVLAEVLLLQRSRPKT